MYNWIHTFVGKGWCRSQNCSVAPFKLGSILPPSPPAAIHGTEGLLSAASAGLSFALYVCVPVVSLSHPLFPPQAGSRSERYWLDFTAAQELASLLFAPTGAGRCLCCFSAWKASPTTCGFPRPEGTAWQLPGSFQRCLHHLPRGRCCCRSAAPFFVLAGVEAGPSKELLVLGEVVQSWVCGVLRLGLLSAPRLHLLRVALLSLSSLF